MRSLTTMMVMVWMVAANGSGMTYMNQPEYTAGTGTNSAYITLDFNNNNSLVFEYKWDGQATGWDALNALDAAGSMNVLYLDFGWGIWIYDFVYPGTTKFDYGQNANAGWAYYTSENNNDWQFSMVGVTGRNLTNGGWDSWVWSNLDANWMPYRQPGQMPIPEPATLIILAFGAGLLTRKKA